MTGMARAVAASRQGPAGPPGPAGVPSATAVAAVAIAAGQPLFVDQTTGQLDLAQADVYARRACVGLAIADTPQGKVAMAEGKVLTLPDWTAATGAPLLAPGRTYFLACAAGGLALEPPPLTPGGRGCSIVRVGIATDARTLALQHAPPILI